MEGSQKNSINFNIEQQKPIIEIEQHCVNSQILKIQATDSFFLRVGIDFPSLIIIQQRQLYRNQKERYPPTPKGISHPVY